MKKITSFFYKGFNRLSSFLLFLLAFVKKKMCQLGLVQKWRQANHSRESLLELLTRADPKASYQQRCEWVIELVLWVKTRSVSSYFEDKPYPEHARVHYLIQMLQKDHELKNNAIKTIQSVLMESSMVSTFSDLGLPVKFAFWEELKFRLYTRLFKYPPNRHHFLDLLRLCLSDKQDALWIKALDHASFAQLLAVLGDDFQFVYQQIMIGQVIDSLKILTIRLSSQGLMSVIAQLQDGSAKQNPFAGVVSAFEALRLAYDKQGNDVNHPDFLAQMNYFRLSLSLCEREIDAIHNMFDERGVSVEVIFYLNSMLRYIDRIRLLLNVWLAPSFNNCYPLWIQLLLTHARSMSIKRLFAYNYRLLAQQINERSAQTGEHYITRSQHEHKAMFKSACGGGALTVITVFLKFLILSLGLAPFATGLVAAANYAISFLAIYFVGFTLATKQPSMTGPALVKSVESIRLTGSTDTFVSDTIALIRSSLSAVLGNLVAVFPIAFVVQLLFGYFDLSFISVEKAEHTLESMSIWGMTPIYAIFTGFLLWSSSLFAGWCDNWFTYHRVDEVLLYNRQLGSVVGVPRLTRWIRNIKTYINPLTANISLGFMLGALPTIISFFGPTVDVRHVTLSTGSFAASIVVLGFDVVKEPMFWWAILGIAITGFLNITVSFLLAFNFALRASGLKGTDRRSLASLVLKTLIKKPCLLFKVES